MGNKTNVESLIDYGDGKIVFHDANGSVVRVIRCEYHHEDVVRLKGWLKSIITTVEREAFAMVINEIVGKELFGQASYNMLCVQLGALRFRASEKSGGALEVLNHKAETLVEKARLLEEEAASQEEAIRAKRKEAAAATEAANLLISIANELEGK